MNNTCSSKLQLRKDSVTNSLSIYLYYFTQVTVKSEEGITYEFPCNHWLASNEEDGKLERDLTPSLTFSDSSVINSSKIPGNR